MGCTETVIRTYSVTDACGNAINVTQNLIRTKDVTPPEINTPATNITVQCDGLGNQSAVANWLANNGGAVASDSCGTVTWTNNYSGITNNCSASVTVEFTATDSCGNSSITTATFNINDTEPPTITPASNLTVECDGHGNEVALNTWLSSNGGATATDNCSVITWSNNYDNFTNSCGASGSASVIFTATDSCGNKSTSVGVFTIQDTVLPTFTAPASITIYTDQNCNYDASIAITGDVTNESDNCSSELQATFVDTITDGSCNGSHIITRTWNLKDNCGNAATSGQVQIITVLDNIAPTFTAPASATIYTDATCAYNASTENTGDVTNEADNCSINLQATFVDTIAPGSCVGAHIITRTWSLVDNCGNKAPDQVQIINVLDKIAPTFTAPASISIFTDSTCNYNATIAVTGDVTNEADNCSINLQATFVDTITQGECSGSFRITRTWSLVDNCGNAAENQVQIITVSDNIKPSFVSAIPTNISVSCDEIPVIPTITATDNCGIPTVTFVETKTEGSCVSNYTLVRTWTATDTCGNFVKASQTVNVSDTKAPTILGEFEAVVNVNCDKIPPVPVLQFVDNCSGVGEIILPSADVHINQTATSYTIIREWKVSDLCGNSKTYTQTINVTIQDGLTEITKEACNGDTSTLSLNALIPIEYLAIGTWVDVSNSGAFHGNNDGVFSPYGLEIGSYIVEFQINDAFCPRKIQVTINVNADCVVLGCGNIIIHNAFSPNNDSFNEFFNIENIEDTACYPSNKVEIYNRWGVLVYETEAYDNSSRVFRGISEGRATVRKSEELPTGTYFYVLEYVSDGKTIKKDGYLYLSR